MKFVDTPVIPMVASIQRGFRLKEIYPFSHPAERCIPNGMKKHSVGMYLSVEKRIPHNYIAFRRNASLGKIWGYCFSGESLTVTLSLSSQVQRTPLDVLSLFQDRSYAAVWFY